MSGRVLTTSSCSQTTIAPDFACAKNLFTNTMPNSASVYGGSRNTKSISDELCDTIDIANREIGGCRVDIICDDNGLFAEEPIVTAMDYLGRPMLVGNLFICSHDDEGNESSLSQHEIICVMSAFIMGMLIGGY